MVIALTTNNNNNNNDDHRCCAFVKILIIVLALYNHFRTDLINSRFYARSPTTTVAATIAIVTVGVLDGIVIDPRSHYNLLSNNIKQQKQKELLMTLQSI